LLIGLQKYSISFFKRILPIDIKAKHESRPVGAASMFTLAALFYH
jgi:hypothetical protein